MDNRTPLRLIDQGWDKRMDLLNIHQGNPILPRRDFIGQTKVKVEGK